MKLQDTCVSIERSTQIVRVGNSICFSFTLLNGLSGQLFYWLLMVFSVITYLLGEGGQVRAILLLSYASPNLLVLGAVAYVICQNMWISLFPGLQSGSPALGVQIKIRILAVIFQPEVRIGA